ncbi:MAG TPA: TonB-dependent receptor [Bryobacteraceae bacterium]|nr:TonB-dependent receptor [Bryobacteraceae bacterium]
MKTFVCSIVAILAMVCAFQILEIPALAQYRAGIQGVVTDPNGGLVADAAVTLTSQETGITHSTATTGTGVYSITGLAPGHYSLSVEKAGFSKKTLSDVVIGAEAMQSVNVQLEVGQTTQSITVEAPVAPLIDTETAMITGTLTAKEVEELPSFGRDPYKLLDLAPGVFGDGALTNGGGAAMLPGTNVGAAGATDSVFKVENGAAFVANGTRQNSNNFQIDGVPVNSASWGGAAVITPNEESVNEVRVIANNYSAENGRTSGAQVEVVSRSGTNEYHGSAFFKWHRPGLDAYQAWNGPGTPSPVQKDENRFNQFGGSVGGPIRKNKLFAFFSYETLRNNSVNVATGWYETSQFLQNAGTSGSIAQKLLSYKGEGPSYNQVIQLNCAQVGLASSQCRDTSNGLDLGSPLTAPLGTGDPTYGQTGTPYGIGNGFDGVPDVQFLQTVGPNVNTSAQYNGRMDYQVTTKDLAAFSIYWVPLDNHFYNGPARAANQWNHTSLAQSWTGIWTHTFAPTLLNEARFGASGWKWNEITSNSQEPWGLPTDNIDSMGSVGVQYYGAPGPSVFNQLTYVYRDTLTKIHASHTLKFGIDGTRATFLDEAPWSARPSYNFRNLWDFANDAPYAENSNFSPVTGQPTDAQKNLRYNSIAFFVQDDWKIKPRLTLNLGLRWEDFTPLTETDGNITNVLLGSGTSVLTGLRLHKGGDLYNNYLNNWGPQVGFAWTPRASNKLVLRGGFGIGYNLEQLAITSNGRFNPPFMTSLYLTGSNILYSVPGSETQFTGWPSNPAAITTFDATSGLPTGGAPVSLTGFPLNFHPSATYRYSLDAQYELGHNWMATVGYSGSQTRHYTKQSNLNWVYYADGLNPMVNSMDWYSNDANAHYNALLAEVQHRFSSLFEIDFQYKLSRNIDDGTQDYYQDNYPWNLAYSYGPADYDATHSFKLWGVYTPALFRGSHTFMEKVFGGWTISGILNAHSGFPWTPQYCNTGGNVVYPNSGDWCLYPGAYSGGAGTDYSNATFMKSNGNFSNGALAYFRVPTWPAMGIPPAPASSIHRNMFRGPDYFGNDFQLAKAFGLPKMKILGEGARLNLQANFYNLFNKLNLNNLNTTISNDGVTSNPQFGQAQGAFAGRIVELQARFSF